MWGVSRCVVDPPLFFVGHPPPTPGQAPRDHPPTSEGSEIENEEGRHPGTFLHLVCMRSCPFFKFPIQTNLSGNYPGTREPFLTSRNVKKGRWVYDGGEQKLIRKLKRPLSNQGACEHADW